MIDLGKKVLLIVPCFNEANRLPIQQFLQVPTMKGLYILFINDGSTDATESVIQQHFSNDHHYSYYALAKNVGKAEAVRQGMLMAASMWPNFSQMDWVGYWDADLATPLEELKFFLLFIENLPEKVQSIWGSRVYRLGSQIERKHSRHFLGRIFATMAKILFHLESYDSQCGAKLFKKEIILSLFSRPFVSTWPFDIEIYLRLKGEKIVEYPLRIWRDQRGSKVRIIRDSWKILCDFYRIRRAYF